MREHRHPHPHRDPRQPRADARPGTNPPVFAWLPVDSASGYRLQVARDPGFEDICLDQRDLQDPLFLPETAFAPGRYFWRWSAGDGAMSEVFAFEIAPEAAVVEVPPAGEWLKRFPAGHPRIYVRPEEVPALRAAAIGERATAWRGLREQAKAVLEEPHEIEEPPFLPDRRESYRAFFEVWSPVMWNSRRFVKGAETLALAYLVGGEDRFARAACQRMASISRWDPEGSSHLGHNDEAHMSVIWHGSIACDWVWDRFTDEERQAVLAQFRRRGQITFDHMHNRGSYGITRFDSHAGREIVFLALIALVFHEHIPEAETWLEWLRPVLCGIWPIWAGDDGAWAEGPSYGLAYVTIMTMFATALKRGAGVDLYRKPFWKNHARWRRYSLPPYAEWMGFGDHTERWASAWRSNADLVDLIGRETETGEFAPYVEALRAEAQHLHTPPKRQTSGVLAQLFLAPAAKTQVGEIPPRLRARIPLPHPPEGTAHGMLQVFPAAGWAAVRTDLDDPARDVAMIFRSSPLGAISHSHANNNDFILHAGGKVLAMPSGYYDGYGSDHHSHWVWHTRSHNCVTLSDASQIMRSHDSTGRIENAFEDEGLIYFRGNADASYSDRALRCRRHVFFLKAQSCFVMIDEFAAAPGIDSALQWNIHSWNRFSIDEEARTFLLERDGSSFEGHFMYHNNAFFSLSEGWDPPPMRAGKDDSQWHQQYHLRFTPSGLVNRRNLGVVLCPGHGSLDRAAVRTERAGETEVARIGEDLVLVGGRGGVAYGNHRSDGLALLIVQDRVYELGDAGCGVMSGDDHGWGDEVKPRSGHSGRTGIDKILKEARRGDLRSVKRHLSQDPSLLLAKSGGHNRTFLWEATRGNRVEVVRFLLRAGADPNVPGRTRAEIPVLLKPYCIARRYHRPHLARMLERAGSVMDIYSACYLGDTDRVQHCLQAEPGLLTGEQKDDSVWRVTPLHYAVAGGHEQLARWLIAEGAQVKPYTRLLFGAAERTKHADLIPVLVEGGADLDLVRS